MRELQSAIVDIYSAPGSTQCWNTALHSINALIGGKATAYVLINKDDSVADLSLSYGYSDEVMARYSGYGGGLNDDVRYKYLHNLVPGQAFRDMEYIESRKEWDESPWNQFELKELGIYYCLSAHVSTHGLWSDYISINRSKHRGPNSDQEKQSLQLLLPHLSRAAELHRLFTSLETRYQAVLSVLDKLLVGLVIVDKTGFVAAANLAAKAIASESGAYQFNQQGRLRLTDTDADITARKYMQQTSATSSVGGHNDGGQMVVPKRSTGEDILLEFLPIRDDGFSDRDNIQGTAVFILDPSRAQTFSTTGIKRIFNLTDSESDVVDALVNGSSVSDIADERNTNANTVRRQLKSVFSKTGTSGQLDLLRKVIKANPPIGSDSETP